MLSIIENDFFVCFAGRTAEHKKHPLLLLRADARDFGHDTKKFLRFARNRIAAKYAPVQWVLCCRAVELHGVPVFYVARHQAKLDVSIGAPDFTEQEFFSLNKCGDQWAAERADDSGSGKDFFEIADDAEFRESEDALADAIISHHIGRYGHLPLTPSRQVEIAIAKSAAHTVEAVVPFMDKLRESFSGRFSPGAFDSVKDPGIPQGYERRPGSEVSGLGGNTICSSCGKLNYYMRCTFPEGGMTFDDLAPILEDMKNGGVSSYVSFKCWKCETVNSGFGKMSARR